MFPCPEWYFLTVRFCPCFISSLWTTKGKGLAQGPTVAPLIFWCSGQWPTSLTNRALKELLIPPVKPAVSFRLWLGFRQTSGDKLYRLLFITESGVSATRYNEVRHRWVFTVFWRIKGHICCLCAITVPLIRKHMIHQLRNSVINRLIVMCSCDASLLRPPLISHVKTRVNKTFVGKWLKLRS